MPDVGAALAETVTFCSAFTLRFSNSPVVTAFGLVSDTGLISNVLSVVNISISGGAAVSAASNL
jgi:hypothetical protein